TGYQFAADARLTDAQLEELYQSDAYAARVCHLVPQEALRQGFRVACGDPAAETALAARLRALDAPGALAAAWTWGRVFGGGAGLVGADDGRDPRPPLDGGSIRAGVPA